MEKVLEQLIDQLDDDEERDKILKVLLLLALSNYRSNSDEKYISSGPG